MTDETTCPDCGARVTLQHTHRLGWYYGDCGRRYHWERGEWESMAPASCLRRQLAKLQAIVDRLLGGLDDYWITTPEGKAAIRDAVAAAGQELHEPAPPYEFAHMPATLDGATVTDPEALLWYIASDGEVYCHHPWSARDIPAMYSTREAAEAAAAAGGDACAT